MEEQKTNETNSKLYDVTEVLDKFGWYHVTQFSLLCIPLIFITMVNINYIFVVGDLNYRCKIPECEDLHNVYDTTWWPNTSIDRCSKPMLREDHIKGAECTNESFSGDMSPCTEWVYETNNTIVAELNLACQPWRSNLVGSIHSAGLMVAIVAGGLASDRFGRKPAFIFCVVSSWVGQLKTLATSYFMYIAIEFCEAAVTGATYAAAMILMLEMCGQRNRAMAGVIFSYATYVGECLFAIIGLFVPYWKTLIHIISGPSILFLSYIFILKESPRWHIINGNTEKAKDILLTVAKVNKINIDRDQLAALNEAELKRKFNLCVNDKRDGLKEIWKSKELLKRVFVATVCRFTVSFVYYGMMVNTVYLPGNKYINFLLTTVMAFPGELISLYLMNKIGRRMPLLVGLLMTAVVSVSMGFMPKTHAWAKILLFLLGKMLISICFTGCLTYNMELFPTSVRGSLLGFVALVARVGSMLAPLTPILNPISEALPSILFACMALLSGILLTLTPETKDLPLIDTVRQVNESVKTDNKMRLTKKQPNDNPEIDAEDPLMTAKG